MAVYSSILATWIVLLMNFWRVQGRSVIANITGEDQFTGRQSITASLMNMHHDMMERISSWTRSGSSGGSYGDSHGGGGLGSSFGSLGLGSGSAWSSLSSSGGSIAGLGNSDTCCGMDFNTFIIGFTLILTLYVFFFLLNATATSGRRRRREIGGPDQDDNEISEELLDAPTWLSMIEELWNSEEEGDACALKALCRMNRLAIEAPGSTGMAVSLSSVPLSYLLYRKHEKGFMTYLDASLMGRNGENCTTIFSSCPRLN